MNLLPTELHLLRPLWLLLLFALPLLWWALARGQRGGGDWARACDPHLLPHLLERRSGRGSRRAQWLGSSITVLLALALAGPAWERLPEPLQRQEAALVIVLDLSPSARATDLKPDRLIRARYKLADLFRLRPDGQTALVAYAGEAFTVAPLTDDSNTIANLIDALDPSLMPVPGKRADLALRHAERLLIGAGAAGGEILLISDRAEPRDWDVATELASRRVRVSVLGLGGGSGAPVLQPGGGFLLDAQGRPLLARLEPESLAALAAAGGGRYAAFSSDGSDLLALGLDRVVASNLRATSGQAQRYRDAGYWLLPPLMLLALLGFRRGWLALVVLLPLSAPTAQAFEWRDLWQRRDQQAATALIQGDVERARALARDPALRGAAAYRGEDWAGAAEEFAQGSDATAHYNRGNALAKAGHMQKAIDAYDAALAQRPDFDDAIANRAAVQQWLEQSQPQPSEGEGEGEGEQSQQEKDAAEGESGDERDAGSSETNDQPSSDGGENGEQGQPQPKPRSPSDAQGDSGGGESDVPPESTPGQEEAQKALSEAIDQALQEQQAEMPEGPAPITPSPEQQAEAERKQSVEQWLRRVPDDPGALLRRKFALEYQRRQREGNR